MTHSIVHFEIPADKPERAAKFYRELFGWQIDRWEGTPDDRESFEYWMVKTVPTDAQGKPTSPGVNGGLMPRMFPQQAPVNYIDVEDLDEFVGRAEKLGAKVMMPRRPVPGMGWFAQLTDTEGNVFALWQTDSNAGAATAAAGGEASRARK